MLSSSCCLYDNNVSLCTLKLSANPTDFSRYFQTFLGSFLSLALSSEVLDSCSPFSPAWKNMMSC